MRNKTKLLPILLGIFLFGCASHHAQVIEKPVMVKCKIPEVPRAELEKIPENATYPVKLQIILNNCLKIQKENELLREAIKVCE